MIWRPLDDGWPCLAPSPCTPAEAHGGGAGDTATVCHCGVSMAFCLVQASARNDTGMAKGNTKPSSNDWLLWW